MVVSVPNYSRTRSMPSCVDIPDYVLMFYLFVFFRALALGRIWRCMSKTECFLPRTTVRAGTPECEYYTSSDGR